MLLSDNIREEIQFVIKFIKTQREASQCIIMIHFEIF